MRRQKITVHLACIALLTCIAIQPPMLWSAVSSDRSVSMSGGGSPSPTPPKLVHNLGAPLIPVGPVRLVLLTASIGERHEIIVRDHRGQVLTRAAFDRNGSAVVDVPVVGGVIDVLGTDALGLPALPGSVIIIVE